MEQCTDRQALLVWEYIRNIEKQYETLNIVPVEINNIIYFFKRLYDEWNTKYKFKHVTIDQDGPLVTVQSGKEIMMCGKEIIKKGVFIWRIRIISFTASE